MELPGTEKRSRVTPRTDPKNLAQLTALGRPLRQETAIAGMVQVGWAELSRVAAIPAAADAWRQAVDGNGVKGRLRPHATAEPRLSISLNLSARYQISHNPISRIGRIRWGLDFPRIKDFHPADVWPRFAWQRGSCGCGHVQLCLKLTINSDARRRTLGS
jgi:hypothetical protein